MSGDWAIQ